MKTSAWATRCRTTSCAEGFDLDDVRAEIRKNCRRRRRGDETAAIENLQAFEHQLRHSRAPNPENLKRLSDAHSVTLTAARALRIASCLASRSPSRCSGGVAANDACA